MKYLIKLFLVLTILALNARAGTTSLDLLRGLNAMLKQIDGKKLTAEEGLQSLFAIGYISGFTESHAVEMKLNPGKAGIYCIPDAGIENEHLARIVQKYLSDDPENLRQSARISVATAFRKAFPCKD